MSNANLLPVLRNGKSSPTEFLEKETYETRKLMKHRSKIIIALTFFMSISATAPLDAQTKREVLTNVKIIELVRLGLGEEIITEKIRQSDC